jgi:uncharacterized protein (AIM24 family)
MVIYNTQTNGASSELVIEVINDSVYVEPHAIAYIVGNLEIKPAIRKFSDIFKSRIVGKKFYRPTISGTGKIYLKPTLGNYHKFSLQDNEKLIITNNAFIACRDTLHMDAEIDPSLAKFISGTPLVSTLISGHGNVVVQMPGEVIEAKLNNDKFVAFSHDVAAYTPNIKVTREPASKTGGIAKSHKLVYVYRGTGSVYFTPHPNKGTKGR